MDKLKCLYLTLSIIGLNWEYLSVHTLDQLVSLNRLRYNSRWFVDITICINRRSSLLLSNWMQIFSLLLVDQGSSMTESVFAGCIWRIAELISFAVRFLSKHSSWDFNTPASFIVKRDYGLTSTTLTHRDAHKTGTEFHLGHNGRLTIYGRV